MGLGVDGTVIADGVDLLALASNFGDSVALGLLELLNELVHDIDEDDLRKKDVNEHAVSLLLGEEKGGLKLPQSQTDTISHQRSLGQCFLHRSGQL